MPQRSDNYEEVVKRYLNHTYVTEGSELFFLTQHWRSVLLVYLV
jgi:hypothetical protein